MPKGDITENADQALREHLDLKGQVEALNAYLDEPRPDLGEKGYHSWAAGLSGRLVKLHDLLFRHFRHEEESRLFDELAERHPNSAGKLDSLKSDHGAFLTELRELTEASLLYSEGKEPPDPRLRRRVSAFLERAGSHEREETKLIRNLLGRDLGGGG